MTLPSTSLGYLESIFPGVLLIPAIDAGRCLSLAPQTCRNKLSRGEFPIKTVLVGGKRLVNKLDLAVYLDSLSAPVRRRGRPVGSTKAAQLAINGEG